MSTVNAAETLYRIHRSGAGGHEAREYLAALDVEVVHPPGDVTVEAGLLRARHYHHRTRPVSLADCTAAAHARYLGMPLATSDGPLVEVLVAEDVPGVPLPDSRGIRPG